MPAMMLERGEEILGPFWVVLCGAEKHDDFVKSWFMPFSATYRERRGAEPDNLFQIRFLRSG
jgi:hypothetical protein